jgi:hypothetical protein
MSNGKTKRGRLQSFSIFSAKLKIKGEGLI